MTPKKALRMFDIDTHLRNRIKKNAPAARAGSRRYRSSSRGRPTQWECEGRTGSEEEDAVFTKLP